MKRDLDLVRKILLKAEEQEGYRFQGDLQIDGYTQQQIYYHVHLMNQAGLVEAAIVENSAIGAIANVFLHKLTWAGHDFLDAARNETVWARVKEKIQNLGGSLAFELVKTMLVETAKGMST